MPFHQSKVRQNRKEPDMFRGSCYVVGCRIGNLILFIFFLIVNVRLEFNYHLNLHGHIQWQGVRSDCASRMIPNRLIEHLHHEIRASVHDEVLMFEVHVGVHDTEDLDESIQMRGERCCVNKEQNGTRVKW
jgi:hypothetical protein